MSTFDGRIREYPAIAIDNFKPNDYAKYFILSHVHKDHLNGLDDCNFNKQIYCTEESAKILPRLVVRHNKQPKYLHLKSLLIPVKYHQVVQLDTPEYGRISFQFLPANHCIGSAMILLKGQNGSILYTGDTRAEPRFFEENLGIIKRYQIQNLYMDTTCVKEDAEKFISKQRSCELLTNLIRKQGKHHHIYIDCWAFGYEECWAHIHDNFKQKVHVSKLKYDTYVEANPIYKEYLTTDASETRFHSCDWDQMCTGNEHGLVAIHFKPTMDDQPRLYIASEKSNHLLQTDLSYDCKPQSRHILPFSYHSSLEEIVAFINYVNAKTLTMCVVREGFVGMQRMRKLLIERGCKLGEINHSDFSLSISSSAQQKRRRLSHDSSSFKKIHSDTAEDPDSHTPDGSGSGSSWKSKRSTFLPTVSKSKLDSIQEKPLSHASVPSKQGSKSQPKSNSQLHSSPAITQPLINHTNISKTPVQEEKTHSIEDKAYGVEAIVETTASTTCSLERPLSWEVVAIIPNTPPPLPPSPKPQDDVIVISSDDEDAKPFMTRLETRRFLRVLRKCHTKNDEYIAKSRATSTSNAAT
ncbi:hypothetical protein PS15p_211140 [Mucor circinelloides]